MEMARLVVPFYEDEWQLKLENLYAMECSFV